MFDSEFAKQPRLAAFESEPLSGLKKMTQSIRIILVDDHTLFRSGVKALLQRQPDFEVIGEASDGTAGVSLPASVEFLVETVLDRVDGGLNTARKA